MKKICKNCGEINSGSAMYCVACQHSLRDAQIQEDYIPSIKKQSSQYSNLYTSDSEVVSMGEWVVILIVLAIPIVNIIALLFMAFASQNENVKNFARASLIIGIIGFLIAILVRGCR